MLFLHVMSKVYTLLFDDPPPRMFPKCMNLLQLNPEAPDGDWFCYEDHTEIYVYVAKLPPYHLPLFLNPRLLSLEYIQ